jgi:cysteine desulfurase
MDTYLDHNATTPVRPEAAVAVADALARAGNPSSTHRFGRLTRRAVDDARETVADLVGAVPAGVVFTSGGTEANNWALRAFPGHVLVSAVEHDSVRGARTDAGRIPVDAEGVVVLDALADMLSEDVRLVSVMLANNETGVIQPIADIASIVHEHGALLHCDAVQAAGKIPLSMPELGADMLTLSAHKLGGPLGVGALVLRPGLDPEPLLRGGGQERRRRAGTENVPGIAGFGAAARIAAEHLPEAAQWAHLRDAIETQVRALCPDVRVHGADAARLPNTSCIGLPDLTGEFQVMSLDLAGVAVSAGSACSSGKIAPSHVLAAMGCDEDTARNAIRVSLGWTTTRDDVARFVEAWGRMASGQGRAQGERRSVA